MSNSKNNSLVKDDLLKQIFNEMFLELEKIDDFDKEIIQNLKTIAYEGRLDQYENVMEVLKNNPQK